MIVCIDCDKPIKECVCQGVLRCSCGIPDQACVCALGYVPTGEDDAASN